MNKTKITSGRWYKVSLPPSKELGEEAPSKIAGVAYWYDNEKHIKSLPGEEREFEDSDSLMIESGEECYNVCAGWLEQ